MALVCHYQNNIKNISSVAESPSNQWDFAVLLILLISHGSYRENTQLSANFALMEKVV